MSGGLVFVVATAGIAFAVAAMVAGSRALKQSKTVDVFERQPQPYMIQAHPPSQKVQTMALPVRDSDMELPRERQA